MGVKDWFKKKQKDDGIDPLTGLTLSHLKIGYYVDYDLKTWEVTAFNTYDWGSGDYTHEWQLTSSGDLLYLEKDMDDEEFWSISRKISFRDLGPGIAEHIKVHDDPPETLKYQGITYFLEEMAGGHFYQNGTGQGFPLLTWNYEDEDGSHFLTIEQWGDDDFAAALGEPVESYQFTNILPKS